MMNVYHFLSKLLEERPAAAEGEERAEKRASRPRRPKT
jgi:hypothetical protein